MVKEFKNKSEQIIESNSKELHKLKLKITTEKYGNEIIELKEFIKKENKFELVQLEVLERGYLTLSIRWHGSEYAKYFIY